MQSNRQPLTEAINNRLEVKKIPRCRAVSERAQSQGTRQRARQNVVVYKMLEERQEIGKSKEIRQER